MRVPQKNEARYHCFVLISFHRAQFMFAWGVVIRESVAVNLVASTDDRHGFPPSIETIACRIDMLTTGTSVVLSEMIRILDFSCSFKADVPIPTHLTVQNVFCAFLA